MSSLTHFALLCGTMEKLLMRLKMLHLAAATAVVIALGAGSALADIVPGTPYASNAGDGNSGLDSFGNSWEWVDSNEGVGIWYTYNFRMLPTYAVYGQAGAASGFEVQFFVPASIPASIVTSELFDQTTGDDWTATVSDATHTVTFAAPAGQTLATGDKYYLKIAFGQLVDGSTIGFSAYFTAPGAGSTIPEISTWAMMGLGFAWLGFGGYRATRKTAAAGV